MSSGGGDVWKVVVDRAALEVSKYMALTTDEFLLDSRTAQWMLALIDKTTLREVLVDRNYGGHCGMIGCTGGHVRVQGRRRDGGAVHAGGENNYDNDDSEDGDEVEVEHEEKWAREAEDAFRRYERYRERRRQTEGSRAGIRLGAPMADRFCSSACAEAFAALMSDVQSSLVYERSEVVQAVGGLFPNMNLAALQRLAGAESTSVADISEKDVEQQHQPQQQQLATSSSVHDVSIEESLKVIENQGAAWSRDVKHFRAISGGRQPEKRHMPLPLLVYDWFLTISTARTKSLFARMCQRGGVSTDVWNPSDNLDGEDSSLYVKCMRPIRSVCMQRVERELMLSSEKKGESLEDDDGPSTVNPQLQQERLALFATHVFSPDATAMLSSLLLYDQGTLRQAWDMWRSSGLLASLQFPFALPGVFGGGGSSPPVLFLGLVVLAATGLCEAAVWAEWMRQSGGSPLAEVMAALGVTADDLVACVRALVVE